MQEKVAVTLYHETEYRDIILNSCKGNLPATLHEGIWLTNPDLCVPRYDGVTAMKQEKSEFDLAQTELRDLKRTVLALRQELEAAHAKAGGLLRAAEATSNAEMMQLKKTVAALREELERSFAEREKTVQQTVVANRNDIDQLKATIASLRIALENAHIERENSIKQALNSANAEISQLHETIRTLRGQMEARFAKTTV